MAIIASSRKFIFVHVPRTGGTALTHLLAKYSAQGDPHMMHAPDRQAALRKHASAKDIMRAIGTHEFETLFKFSFVRNPFVRAVSIFNFLRKTFRELKRPAVMVRLETLEQFVTSDFFAQPGGIHEPQAQWLTDDAGRLRMDFIGKGESLDSDIAFVFKKLDFPDPPPPIARNEPRIAAAVFESKTVADSVRQRYEIDFDLFGYSRDPEQARSDHSSGADIRLPRA